MPDKALLLELAGPVLAGYLQTPDVTNIFCNDNGTCFLERVGYPKREVEHPGFKALLTWLEACAHEANVEFRAAVPRMSAAFPDLGWRIEAARPPVTTAPFAAIRLFPTQVFSLETLLAQGVFTQTQYDVLTGAMQDRQRILLCGATGSAKTTVVNSLLHYMRDTDVRFLILEDDPEIQSSIRDCSRTWLDKGKETLQTLVKNALRLTPTVIVVGEVRDGAALDLLQCWQTGHGGLGTVHVDTPEGALLRMEQLVNRVSQSPQRELIGEAIDLIVHMQRLPGEGWRCQGILTVGGWNGHTYQIERIA